MVFWAISLSDLTGNEKASSPRYSFLAARGTRTQESPASDPPNTSDALKPFPSHAVGARKHAGPRPAVRGLQGQRNAHHEASQSSAQPAGSAHPVRAADTSDLWETYQPQP